MFYILLVLMTRIDFEFGSGVAYLKTHERQWDYNNGLKLKVGMKHDKNTWQWQMHTTSLKKRESFERLTFSNEFPEHIWNSEIHWNPETTSECSFAYLLPLLLYIIRAFWTKVLISLFFKTYFKYNRKNEEDNTITITRQICVLNKL